MAIVARRADGPSTILMRELDSPAARPLAGTEGATSLFWSPDNRFIGFFAEGKVKKVDLLGGVPIELCAATTPFGGGTWSRDGTIVFSMQEKGNYRLWKVADSGGQPTDALPDGPAGEADQRSGDPTLVSAGWAQALVRVVWHRHKDCGLRWDAGLAGSCKGGGDRLVKCPVRERLPAVSARGDAHGAAL